MNKLTENLIALIITVLIIAIGILVIAQNFSPEVTATESASEARQLLRDCTNQPGAVATVKTIWAGTPPVPVEYEITCQQEKAQ